MFEAIKVIACLTGGEGLRSGRVSPYAGVRACVAGGCPPFYKI
jgi:hypothetical protein